MLSPLELLVSGLAGRPPDNPEIQQTGAKSTLALRPGVGFGFCHGQGRDGGVDRAGPLPSVSESMSESTLALSCPRLALHPCDLPADTSTGFTRLPVAPLCQSLPAESYCVG